MHQSSPASSSPSSSTHEQPPHRTSHLSSHHPVHIHEQPNLHLVSCAWDEFLRLDLPSSGYYDYVDRLLVRCPRMANTEHDGLAEFHATILECTDSNLFVHPTPSVQVISDNRRKEWTVEPPRKPDGASSSTSPPPAKEQVQYGLRHPDYSFTRSRRDSTGSSSTSRDPAVTNKIRHPHPYSSKFEGLAEITSTSTRQVDLYTKWTAYARSEVPLYIIFDRGTKTRPRRVIVGATRKFSGAEKSWHGDPDEPIKTKTRPEDGTTYYKKVYNPSDRVDCPIFCGLNLTAAELLDWATMKTLARQMHYERAVQRERAEREKEGREREKEGRERAEQERDRAEQERDREKRKREREKQKRERERQQRERAEQERDKEKKRRGREKQKRKTAERRLQELEEQMRKSSEQGSQQANAPGGTHAEGKDIAGPSGHSPTKSPQHKKTRKKD